MSRKRKKPDHPCFSCLYCREQSGAVFCKKDRWYFRGRPIRYRSYGSFLRAISRKSTVFPNKCPFFSSMDDDE